MAALVAAVLAALSALPLVRGTTSGLVTGVVLGMVPALVGAVFLAVHAVGELTWPRPTGTVRAASLSRRTVRDIAPRGLRVLVWSLTVAVAAAVVVGGLTAAPDGRSMSRATETTMSAVSPYPGWFYGVPLLIAAIVVLAGTEAVLRLVAQRAAVVGVDTSWDLALRRLSAHRILRAAQVPLALTLSGVLVLGSSAAARLDHPGVGVLAGVGALVSLGSVLVLCLPGRAPGDPEHAGRTASAQAADAPLHATAEVTR